jgi:transcriptional regulator with XRE-family HTH domain
MNIGARVREAREDLGMSQAELARRAGVARNHIVMIEHGGRTPSVGLLEKIAHELRTEPAELLREPAPLAEASETGPSDQGADEEQLPKTVAEVRAKFLPIAAMLEDYCRAYEQIIERAELTSEDVGAFVQTALEAYDYHKAALEVELRGLGYVLDRDRKLNQKQQLYDLSVLRPAFARYYELMQALVERLPAGADKSTLVELTRSA